MARKTFTHKTEDGRVQTRTSASKDYTHVVVGYGTPYGQDTGWHVIRWSESEANATKAAMGTGRELAAYAPKRAEAINGGER